MGSYKTPLIYCISLIACFWAGVAIDLACGGEADPYDYYVSFFHNDLLGGKEYKPFYFTDYLFLYDDNEPQSETAINAAEWAVYLGKDVNVNDVDKAMYRLNSRTDSALLAGYLKSGADLPDTLAGNTFLKALKKTAEALKYYRFAKSVEKIAGLGTDKWNAMPLDSAALHKAGLLSLKNGLSEKDKFLQLRYYYQSQRLLHYSYSYKEARFVYDKYIADNPSQSHVKGWALALKAGEERHLKDTVMAAYLFSKVFSKYPERRVQAYRNYNYMHVKPQQVLALANNNNDKAVIYAISGFSSPALDLAPLQKVYGADPTSPMVGVLLIREINKLEETYLTPKLVGSNQLITSDYYVEGDDKKNLGILNHIVQLDGFCKILAADRKYPDYNIGNIAGAYLAWMQGDNTGGFALLNALDKQTLKPAINDQKQIIKLLLSAQAIQKFNELNEAQLLPALKWLDDKVKTEAKVLKDSSFTIGDGQKFTITARAFYQQVLAPAYLRQGDTTRAAVALLKSCGEGSRTDFWDNYLHPAQIARLIRWKKTPFVGNYLGFLSDKLATIKMSELNDLLGTAYLREHQYAKATAAFKLIDEKTLNESQPDFEKGDPFIDQINDYPKVLRYDRSKGYNKLQFALAMASLEQRQKTDPANAALYAYRYATGLYNTSHYGNSPYLISYNWSSDDFGRAKKYSYDDDYVRTKNAEAYYLLARSLSRDEEFKAKCTVMAAKCLQKEWVKPAYGLADYQLLQSAYMRQLKQNDYFAELKSQYRKTAIYKKALGDCSYLKDFVTDK